MKSIYNKLGKICEIVNTPLFLVFISLLYLISLFAIIGNANEHKKYLPEGKLTLDTIGYLFTIFAYPWLISILKFDSQFTRTSLKIMKWLSVGFTGFAAIMWYTNATNPYFEAATVLIGYATLVINSSQKNLEQRLVDSQTKETT